MTFDERMAERAASRNLGALATLKRDGRPQLSAVNYTFDPQTRDVRISVTDGRAKTNNLRRDPRASLMVFSADGWSYTVLEGDAELSAVAQERDDTTVEALIELYRDASGGEHSDWDDYRRAMVEDKRLVLTIHVTKVYGLT